MTRFRPTCLGEVQALCPISRLGAVESPKRRRMAGKSASAVWPSDYGHLALRLIKLQCSSVTVHKSRLNRRKTKLMPFERAIVRVLRVLPAKIMSSLDWRGVGGWLFCAIARSW